MVCGVEKQADRKFPVWDIIHRVGWIQAVKIHTINSVLISKQTVAPEGGVCVRVSRQKQFCIRICPSAPETRLLSASQQWWVMTKPNRELCALWRRCLLVLPALREVILLFGKGPLS